jgi:cbb3-type cytochrome oxidase subunit 3
MLKSITFGTFYFFLVFCLILVVWVYFFVPETKGRRIEEMDAIFGGNQGVEDMARIADIRRRLGISEAVGGTEGTEDEKVGVEQGSEKWSEEDKGVGFAVSHHEA